MDTLKFNTFANSPKTMSKYPSNLPSNLNLSPHYSDKYLSVHHRYPNIPELKREMQAAINSRRASRSSVRSYNKYDSQISLMKSDISLLSDLGAVMDRKDLVLSMLEVEVGVTE